VDRVSCGGAYTIATTAPANSSAPPVTYLWGQQKSSGEANMYPKALMDLSGWSVRRLSPAIAAALCWPTPAASPGARRLHLANWATATW
ncbi:hypothetical protein BOX15_Mlig022524g1, partial [Macrostomum lignano]